jgi:formylglycine-generating enzyme required for sulfatase activity
VTNPVDQIETALIPAGAFTMGDDNGRPDERPAHRVTLSAFRMAVLPVTNEEYAAFLTATGQKPPRFWDDSAFNASRSSASAGTTP